MKGYAKDIFFPENYGVEPEFFGGGHVSTSAGTFSLRRAHYLGETGEPFLSAKQHRALTNLIREDDPATKKKMIVHNLIQVINIAKRYNNRGLELFDLVRAGNEGLIQALKRYEPEAGSCFSTFVSLCVCQHINLAILNQKKSPKTIRYTPVSCFQSVMG